MSEPEEKEHWSLYLLDTYILYNLLYLIIVIWLSTRGGGGLGYLWYKLYPFPNDVTRFKQHRKWWKDEAARNRIAVSGEQEGGGSNKYSLKTWTIVLLWSIFLFIMAILFPKRTKDAFSNVTMPSMFKDSILDTGKSDSEKLSFLYRHIWSDSTADKYTVQPEDVEDIEFIRRTDAEYRKSNIDLKDKITFEKEGFVNLKTVCGNSNDSTKLLNKDDQYKCMDGLNMRGENCHNKSKSPCCQRYCPSDSGYGTYHAGNDQGGITTTLTSRPTNRTAPNWQCNTESVWNQKKKQCMHILARTPTEQVYVPVSSDGVRSDRNTSSQGTSQVSMGGNLTGDVEI